MLTGTCLCGESAFEVDGPVEIVGHCHCSMCRKFHGSAFATFGTAAVEDFRWVRGAERVRKHKSSAQGYRHFCPRCGSAVPMSGAGQPFALLPMGNVAEEPGTRPRLHFFTGSMARLGTLSWTTCLDMRCIRWNSGRTPLRWTVLCASQKRRAPSGEAASAVRSHSNSTAPRYGCTTATALDAEGPSVRRIKPFCAWAAADFAGWPVATTSSATNCRELVSNAHFAAPVAPERLGSGTVSCAFLLALLTATRA